MRLRSKRLLSAGLIGQLALWLLGTPSWARSFSYDHWVKAHFSESVQDIGIPFGGELEFSDPELIEKGGEDRPNNFERRAAERFAKRVRENCPDCKVTPERIKWGEGEYRVTSPDGYWFNISYDPGCVEIQTQPMTLTELRTHAASMDRVIFGAAHDIGLEPNYEEGAGHMNFGALEAFGNDGEKSADEFLEYAADFSDHPQLAEGALGEDYTNAPPMNWLKQQQRDAFDRIMAEARSHRIPSIKQAAQRIQNNVYTSTATHSGSGYHYQALSVKKLNKPSFPERDAPIEIRAEYPQRSMEDFIRDAEVISRRVEYLRVAKPPLVFFNIRRRAQTYQEVVDMYYKYLDEMGLSYDRYKVMMPSAFQEVEPSDFVRGDVVWDENFASSIEEFMPHIRTSEWVRERMMAAFTDPTIVDSALAQREFVKLIKSIKPASPTRGIEEKFVEDVLNHPIWQKVPSRAGIIRFLKERLPTTEWNDLLPTERPMPVDHTIVPTGPDHDLPPGRCGRLLIGE